MAPKKSQLALVAAAAPLQVGPGADQQFRIAAGLVRPLPQIQHPPQVGIVPAADQQQGTPQQRWGHRMDPPIAGPGRIQAEPPPSHPPRVMADQQSGTFLQKTAALQAAANLPPAGFITAAAAGGGGQLQGPGQAQAPPMGTPRTRPVETLVQAGHGGGQTIGQGIGQGIVQTGWGRLLSGGDQQLAEPLIRKAVAAHQPIAQRQASRPAHRRGPIDGLLAEAPELAFGITAAAHVLHHDHKAPVGIPTGVGVGDGGSDGPAVGLAHQQHRPGSRSLLGEPETAGQQGTVVGPHRGFLGPGHSEHVGAVQADHIGRKHFGIHGRKSLVAGHAGNGLGGGGGLAAGVELLELGAKTFSQAGVLLDAFQQI